MAARAAFAIRQQEETGFTRLSVAGELDLATAPALEHQLKGLRTDRLRLARFARLPVLLDLSKLEFMDSTGVGVLFRAISWARNGGWRLEIASNLTPQVNDVARMTRLDEFLVAA
jgi:anti-anti-sigma factor